MKKLQTLIVLFWLLVCCSVYGGDADILHHTSTNKGVFTTRQGYRLCVLWTSGAGGPTIAIEGSTIRFVQQRGHLPSLLNAVSTAFSAIPDNSIRGCLTNRSTCPTIVKNLDLVVNELDMSQPLEVWASDEQNLAGLQLQEGTDDRDGQVAIMKSATLTTLPLFATGNATPGEQFLQELYELVDWHGKATFVVISERATVIEFSDRSIAVKLNGAWAPVQPVLTRLTPTSGGYGLLTSLQRRDIESSVPSAIVDRTGSNFKQDLPKLLAQYAWRAKGVPRQDPLIWLMK